MASSNCSSVDGLLLQIESAVSSKLFDDYLVGVCLAHKRALRLLHDTILKDPALDQTRIVFVGFSAGSTFLSGDYLPEKATEYKGGAVMLCGGGPPVTPSSWQVTMLEKGFDESFKLYYYIAEDDFLYRQTMEGIYFWKMRRASPILVAPKSGGHCGFDFIKTLELGLTAVLGAP